MSYALACRTFDRVQRDSTFDRPSVAPTKHFAALDGVRGVAILMVVASHYGSFFLRTGVEGVIRETTFFGYTGVTLFFVLSGFLITRILVQTRDNPDYFQTFYARRSLRIFPLYFAYLAFVFLVYYPLGGWLFQKPYRLDSQVVWYLTYTSNWRPGDVIQPGLMHMWSLAIEEQFYMIWPLVVYLTPRRWLLPLCAVGFFASLGSRIAMDLNQSRLTLIYGSTITRMDALLIGAAVGIIQLDAAASRRLVRAIWPVTVVCVLGLIPLALTGGFAIARVAVNTAGWSILAVLYAALVFWAATAGATNRFLLSPTLRTIGKYSYGIYVLHLVAHPILERLIHNSTLTQRIGLILANIAVTAVVVPISWYCLEQPFLRRKRQVQYGS